MTQEITRNSNFTVCKKLLLEIRPRPSVSVSSAVVPPQGQRGVAVTDPQPTKPERFTLWLRKVCWPLTGTEELRVHLPSHVYTTSGFFSYKKIFLNGRRKKSIRIPTDSVPGSERSCVCGRALTEGADAHTWVLVPLISHAILMTTNHHKSKLPWYLF